MKSLHGRLMWRLLAGVGLLLAVAAFLLNLEIERRLRSDFDRSLEERARALASIVEQDEGRIWLEYEPDAHPEYLPGASVDYFELRGAGGETILLSKSAGARRLPLGGPLPGETSPRFADLELPDGRRGRVVAVRFTPRPEHDGSHLGWYNLTVEGSRQTAPSGSESRPEVHGLLGAEVLVARERESLEGFLSRLSSVVLGFCLALLVALAALIAWTLGSELAPVKGLAERLSRVSASSLDTRIEGSTLPAELSPMVARLNELLARLQLSFERERTFSTQLAHELRTPLAELRVAVEVALRWPDEPQEMANALEEVGDIGRQMERLVGNLLSLARADAGVEPLDSTTIALAAAVDRALDDVARRLGGRGIEALNRVDRGLEIVAPAPALDLILANLAANAATYATVKSWVEVDFESEAGNLRWRNPTTELAPDDLERLFERFWRKREERSVGEHAGLGLTLVRSLARRLGGDATARLEDGVLTVEISGLVRTEESTTSG